MRAVLKERTIPYLLFYVVSLALIGASIFCDKKLLSYIYPALSISMFFMYVQNVKKHRVLYIIALVLSTTTNVLIYLDFIKYFVYLASSVGIFFVLCAVMLKGYLSKRYMKLKGITSPPFILSILLIAYLVYYVKDFVVPAIADNIEFLIFGVICTLFFCSVCFSIYISDRYEKTNYLFISACSTLFLVTLTVINEVFFNDKIFTILVTIAEVIGFYFFTNFLIETKPRKKAL